MNTIATLTDMLGVLALANSDKALIFDTDEGPIGGGYHVTELKHLAINSIDCGGRTAAWGECHLQLLDGATGTHMSVAKFSKIATNSVKALPDLATGPIFVEYAPGNQGLRRYRIATVDSSGADVRVHLEEARAGCKPAMERRASGDAATDEAATGKAATGKAAAGKAMTGGCCGSSAAPASGAPQAQGCCA